MFGTCGGGQTGGGFTQMPSIFMTCGGGHVHELGFDTVVQELLFAELLSAYPELDGIATEAQFVNGGNGGPISAIAGIMIGVSTWFAVRAPPFQVHVKEEPGGGLRPLQDQPGAEIGPSCMLAGAVSVTTMLPVPGHGFGPLVTLIVKE